jgi:hypothetical protein
MSLAGLLSARMLQCAHVFYMNSQIDLTICYTCVWAGGAAEVMAIKT